ncbi:MAG: Spy/CpxP family protein refolding chaperone [Sedimentisphaerales bacterium]|nr:Spy/CpxP family protein refolding chaperone [Sedimentisphaerales bacterium]
MKTGWKMAVVVVVVVALVGSVAVAGPGGGWGRGPAHARGPAIGPGMGMGMGPGMGAGMGMGPGTGPCMLGAGPMRPPRGNALGAIGAWLDLTREQKTQIREIQEKGKKDAEAARDAVADARDALHEAVISGAAEAKIRAAATALGEAIGNEAALHAKTMAAVKAVLTEEQRKEFDEMRAERPGLGQRAPHGPGPFCPWVGPNQGPQARMRGQGSGGGPVPTEQMFKAADTNKDGKLTRQELRAFRNTARGGPRFRQQL